MDLATIFKSNDMDLSTLSMKIKKEYQNHDESEDTLHIKLEVDHPNEADYDGIKIEEVNIKQEKSDSYLPEHEYNCMESNEEVCETGIKEVKNESSIDIDPVQLTEESGLKIYNHPNANTTDNSVLHSKANEETCGKEQEVLYRGKIKLLTCYNCNYTARYKRSLIAHIKCGNCNLKNVHTRQNLSNEYVCTQCNVMYKKKTFFDDHVIKKHIEDIASVSSKIHKCKNCDYKTTRKNCFDRHMVKHTGAFKLRTCNHCDALFKSKKGLNEHILKKHPSYNESVSGKIHECTYCSYKTTFAVRLATHMMKHTGKSEKFMCTNCDASFKIKYSLDDHILKMHPSFATSVSSKIYECMHCAYKSTMKYNLIKHMMKHGMKKSAGKLFMCTYCDASYKNKQSLDNHVVSKHPSFSASVSRKIHECTHCSYRTTYSQNLKNHMMKHTIAPEMLFMCTDCDESFKSKRSLDGHVLIKHPSLNASVSRKIHECVHCSYKTTYFRNFSRHMKNHTGKRKCTNCDTSFESMLSLYDHILKNHPSLTASISNKIHECTLCSYRTAFKYNMTTHMAKHTGNFKKFTCINCGVSFRSKKWLGEHILKNHPSFSASISNKIHECPHCAYKTTYKYDMTRHMEKHTRKSGKVTCTNCDMSFKSQQMLSEHILKNHPSLTASIFHKIHECTHCAYKTTFKNDMTRHMVGHAIKSERITCTNCDMSFRSQQVLSEHILKNHPSLTASVSHKIHECTHCAYKTTFKNDMTRHMLGHTIKSERITCTNCDMSFRSQQVLSEHILKNHPSLTASVSHKIHECTHCAYKTTFKNDMTRHMLGHTIKSERIICTNCDMSFKSQQFLSEHILKHHPSLTASISHKIHECTLCPYRTTFKYNMTTHMAKHTGKSEMLTCINCDASFKRRKALDDHISQCNPCFNASSSASCEKPEHCNETAWPKIASIEHIDIGKSNEKTDTRQTHFADTVQFPLNGYLCKQCNMVFKNKASLDNHVIKNHTELIELVSSKIHRCFKCDYKTTHSSHLHRHLLTHLDNVFEFIICDHCDHKLEKKKFRFSTIY